MTPDPVGEHHRNLADAAAEPPHSVGDLDLESVPLRTGLRVVDLLQGVGAVGPVPRGRITHLESEHHSRVSIAVPRERPAEPRPVRDQPTRYVPGSDRHVRAVVDGVQQRRNEGGVVREVSVDLDQGVIPMFDTPGEAGPVGLPEPLLGRSVQHGDVPELLGHPLGDRSRAIGTAVVDDEDVCIGNGVAGPTKELFDVLRLLIRRSDDQRPHPRRLQDSARLIAAIAASVGPLRQKTRADDGYAVRHRRRLGPAMAVERIVGPVLADEAELLLHDDVRLVRAEVPGVVRLTPVVPRRRQDQDVGPVDLLGQSGIRRVRDSRIHLDVLRAGDKLGEQVVEEGVAERCLAKVVWPDEEPLPRLRDALDLVQQLVRRRRVVRPSVIEEPTTVRDRVRTAMDAKGLQRVVSVGAHRVVRDDEDEHREHGPTRGEADGTAGPSWSSGADNLEERDGEEGHRDAGHPCQVGRVGPLERLREDPDAEGRDGEEHPRPDRRPVTADCPHADHGERDNGSGQQEEEQADLGRTGDGGNGPAKLVEIHHDLDGAVEVTPWRRQWQSASATQLEQRKDDHALPNVRRSRRREMDQVGRKADSDAQAESLLDDARAPQSECQHREADCHDEVDAVQEREPGEEAREQRESSRPPLISCVAARGSGNDREHSEADGADPG